MWQQRFKSGRGAEEVNLEERCRKETGSMVSVAVDRSDWVGKENCELAVRYWELLGDLDFDQSFSMERWG